MAQKSKKSKSKRMSLKQKYKIVKKVKEHHKKKAKEEKKLGKKRVPPKDPGIPNQWPFKAELLKELDWEKKRAVAEDKRRKEERKRARVEAEVNMEDTSDASDADITEEDAALRGVAQDAQNKQQTFESNKRLKKSIQPASSDKDSSRRAFYKEFVKVVEAADVVIEVLDARDPLGCRCLDVERLVRKSGADKKVILLLNKIDLGPCEIAEAWLKCFLKALTFGSKSRHIPYCCTDLVPGEVAEAWLKYLSKSSKSLSVCINCHNPTNHASKCCADLVPREVAEAWLKYLREELPTVAFKCSTQKQASNLGQRQMPKASSSDAALHGSESLGANALLHLLKNYTRNSDTKTAITVGVVGFPNVGKSSLLNSLKRTRVAQVGNTPGVTRAVQEVVLDKHLRLLDSPGIVFADSDSSPAHAASQALRNCVKVEKLDDAVLPVSEIVKRCPAKQLMSIYKIAGFSSTDEFLQRIAQARGKLKKGGTSDLQAAAKIVLQDWNDGRIPYYTMPPQREAQQGHAAAEVVTNWGTQFDADEVFGAESTAVIEGLPSLQDSADFFQTQSAGPANADLEAMEQEHAAGSSQADAVAQAMDETDAAPASVPTASKATGDSQAQELYSAPDQFNPHAARAQKKKAKKQKKQPAAEQYDFDEAFGQQAAVV